MPIRIALAKAWAAMYSKFLDTVSSDGGLGTVCNLQQIDMLAEHALNQFDPLILHAARLKTLPAAARLPQRYQGTPRLIVPTIRTLVRPATQLRIKAIVLARHDPVSVRLIWRPMGSQQQFQVVSADHAGRGVYYLMLPLRNAASVEYRIVAVTRSGQHLTFPASASHRCQTVVVLPN